MSRPSAPEAGAPVGGARLGARVVTAAALALGAVNGDLVWRAQVDAALRAPPAGWREAGTAPELTALFDWGPLRPRRAQFAPAGGATWIPQGALRGRPASLGAEVEVPSGGWAELWLGEPGAASSVGLRLDRVADADQVVLLGVGACGGAPARLPPGPVTAQLRVEGAALRWAVAALEGGPCPLATAPRGAALRAGARQVGFNDVILGGEPLSPAPRPYRGGAWLIGAGLAACFALAQLAVGSPAWVAALTLAPLLLVLPLAAVDPGPAHGLPLGLPDPGPYGLAAAPALLGLLMAVTVHAGRAMRDPRPARDWPWAAPAAAAMPAALLNAWVNPPASPVVSALIGGLGGACVVACLVGTLALAGHARPRRAAALALIPAVAFGCALSVGARSLAVVGGAAAVGLLLGLAAAELSRRGPRAWTAGIALLGAVLALDLGLRAAGRPPAPARPPPLGPTDGGADARAEVWGERPEHGPGTISDALGAGWTPTFAPGSASGAPPALVVVVVGERLLSDLPLGPGGVWGAALDLRRSWRVARARALAPALIPRVDALRAQAAARGLPTLLVMDPRQPDPSALASVRAALQASLRAPTAAPAALVDPAALAWAEAKPLIGGTGWLRTPEGGAWYGAAVRRAAAALVPEGPPR